MIHESGHLYRLNYFGEWHRRPSLKRWLEEDEFLWAYDVDDGLFIQTGPGLIPLFLIESAHDSGQEKRADHLVSLARYANQGSSLPPIPVYITLYTLSDDRSMPSVPQFDGKIRDIDLFRVKRAFPEETEWRTFTPREWARKLLEIRARRIDELTRAGYLGTIDKFNSIANVVNS